MRILVLLPDAFGGHGGIAKFSRDFLRALCAHPACQEVVAVPRRMPNPVAALPIKLTYVTSGLAGKLSYVAAVSKTVRRNPEFDLIICGHINLLPIAYALRIWVKAPVALVVHGIEAWEPTRRPLVDFLVRKIDALISVSELTKQRFLGWAKSDGSAKFLLPNAVDLECFGPGPKTATLLDKYGLVSKTVLMTLGRLVSAERYKGFDEVLDLLPDLIKEVPHVAYLIAGDGPDRWRLEEKARSLGVNEHVAFAGLIPECEKADHYRLADVYVMPSRGEGFGIVYLEAMASGIPVVASKLDGGREAVREGALGVLVDPRDQEDVSAGVLEALNRPRGVVPQGLDYFSYSNFEQRLHSIIDQVLQS